MDTMPRMATAVALFLVLTGSVAQAQTQPRRGLLARLIGRGEERVAHRMHESPAYHPAAPPVYEYQLTSLAPMPAEATSVAAAPADPSAAPADSAADPYGFTAILNGYRAQVGLPPVAVDPNLAAWASQNNAAQCHRGLGHHVVPGCLQNSGWNYASAWDVFLGWLHSPGHRATMLSPSISRVGIAYGPGPYWTLNAL
ncbi:MAG: hypothetical protein KatS3mg108_0145 [Isosphaeraceae bacterium]|jgi:uncharacterized protein YkwD|nr:MAG: hypothetical protein KatS3mg108_0145 [Isosphaeraceae bacterium]